MSFKFHKSERITSLKEIDALFERGKNSATQTFPIRAVYQTFALDKAEKSENATAPVPAIRVLVSVAKKRLHHAVDRNRAKRQIREAYRLQHQSLTEKLLAQSMGVRIAFIWLGEEPQPTSSVFSAMQTILSTIEQRLTTPKR